MPADNAVFLGANIARTHARYIGRQSPMPSHRGISAQRPRARASPLEPDLTPRLTCTVSASTLAGMIGPSSPNGLRFRPTIAPHTPSKQSYPTPQPTANPPPPPPPPQVGEKFCPPPRTVGTPPLPPVAPPTTPP